MYVTKETQKENDAWHVGCNESHFLFAVRKDRRKGNGWRMQQKSFPFCRQKRQTKRTWMADGTKVIPCLLSEKTDKNEMDGGCNKSHSLLAVRKDRQKGNGWRMQQKSFPFRCQKGQTKRKWMADATKVISFLLAEKTHKQEMMSAMADATNLFQFLAIRNYNVENACTKTVEMSIRGKEIVQMPYRGFYAIYLNAISALVVCNCNKPMVT